MPEAVGAARAELERRGIDVPDLSVGRTAEETRRVWNEAEHQRQRRAWWGRFLMYVGAVGFIGQLAGRSVLGGVPLPGALGFVVMAAGFYLVMRAKADAEDAARLDEEATLPAPSPDQPSSSGT